MHKVAKGGFVDGLSYDRYRDSYSTDVVTYVANYLHEAPNSDPQYNVLELGAGTGLFTREMLTVLPKNTRYLATDALETFLDVLKQKSPGIEAKIVNASSIPLPDCSVENILCAQSFHWFANETSLKEMTRVLTPGGKVFIIRINNKKSRPWLVTFEEILADHHNMNWRKWQDAIDNFKPLRCLEHKYIERTPILGDKETAIKRFLTYGAVACLDDQSKQKAVSRLQAALDEEFQDGEQVVTHIEYELYCAQKI